MNVLAGDIGGSRIRLAIIDVQAQRLKTVYENAFLSRDFDCLEAALESFVAQSRFSFDSVCLGIAGPVLQDRCVATNLPWAIDSENIRRRLSARRVTLINDLVANALGIRALSAHDFYIVNPGRADRDGNACIIAAGTGLGEAGMIRHGDHYQPLPSEGGHCDFAPGDDFDYRLLRFLRDRYGHVSWERVVSGMGIVDLFEFLCHENSEAPPEWFKREKISGDAASAVSGAAMSGTDPRCLETMRRFLRYYGAETGNLALKMMATGGIYIGGGIAPKIIALFKGHDFFESMCAKGRMQALLRSMPVKVILNERCALLGAAIRAARLA